MKVKITIQADIPSRTLYTLLAALAEVPCDKVEIRIEPSTTEAEPLSGERTTQLSSLMEKLDYIVARLQSPMDVTCDIGDILGPIMKRLDDLSAKLSGIEQVQHGAGLPTVTGEEQTILEQILPTILQLPVVGDGDAIVNTQGSLTSPRIPGMSWGMGEQGETAHLDYANGMLVQTYPDFTAVATFCPTGDNLHIKRPSSIVRVATAGVTPCSIALALDAQNIKVMRKSGQPIAATFIAGEQNYALVFKQAWEVQVQLDTHHLQAQYQLAPGQSCEVILTHYEEGEGEELFALYECLFALSAMDVSAEMAATTTAWHEWIAQGSIPKGPYQDQATVALSELKSAWQQISIDEPDPVAAVNQGAQIVYALLQWGHKEEGIEFLQMLSRVERVQLPSAVVGMALRTLGLLRTQGGLDDDATAQHTWPLVQELVQGVIASVISGGDSGVVADSVHAWLAIREGILWGEATGNTVADWKRVQNQQYLDTVLMGFNTKLGKAGSFVRTYHGEGHMEPDPAALAYPSMGFSLSPEYLAATQSEVLSLWGGIVSLKGLEPQETSFPFLFVDSLFGQRRVEEAQRHLRALVSEFSGGIMASLGLLTTLAKLK